MKKTLVLASLLAAFGAASAQSSVTLAGVADAWLGQTKSSAYTGGNLNAGSGVSQTAIGSGGQNGSRITVRGTESLGAGLNAVFQIETGLNLDTALPRGNFGLGDRQAFVGLNGGFGTLTLGRQYSAYDDLRGATDTLGHTAFSASLAAFANGSDYTARINNSMKFKSANYSGFSVAAMVGLGEDKTSTLSAGSNQSVHALYAAGPIVAGVAFQTEKPQGSGAKLSHTLVAGSYNFGFAKLSAGYNTSKVSGSVADKELAFGANLPFGAMSIDIGMATSKNSSSTKATSLGAHLNYDLSPRTRAYAGLNNTKKTNVATSLTTAKSSLFAVGVRHSF